LPCFGIEGRSGLFCFEKMEFRGLGFDLHRILVERPDFPSSHWIEQSNRVFGMSEEAKVVSPSHLAQLCSRRLPGRFWPGPLDPVLNPIENLSTPKPPEDLIHCVILSHPPSNRPKKDPQGEGRTNAPLKKSPGSHSPPPNHLTPLGSSDH